MKNGLRSVIEAARDETSGSLKDFTVLSTQIDPYRLDTPANHEVGRWFAEQMDRLDLLTQQLHLRGIHYALLGSTTMPNGKPYPNTGEVWDWLQNSAAKAARWLGYVSFESITDARNEKPIVRIHSALPTAWRFVSVQPRITMPEVEAIEPHAHVDIHAPQPYRLALYGEKTSLAKVLGPIADSYGADLFLPTGEISDTQMYLMAKAGAEDGRKLVVFTVTDFDPSGWQMTVSIGRKLQALKDLLFPDLEFEIRPIALTGEQVRTLDLPSTPLKETEKRADKWREYMEWEQTEIDALATLQPDVLRQIVRDALDPFYDHTLRERVYGAERDWRTAAQAIVDEQLDREQIGMLREAAERQIEEMRERLAEIEMTVRTATEDLNVDLPEAEIPEPEIDESLQGEPLLSSAWSWAEQTRALISRKSYADEDTP